MSAREESRVVSLPAEVHDATVVPLRPIRTLALSCDLAARQRVTTVLRDLGPACFAVCPVERPGDVLALVLRQAVDVVVLDVTLTGDRLVSIVAVLAERVPDVGVVAIADRAGVGAAGLVVLAKWGWATELVDAVRDARRCGNPLHSAGVWDRDAT